MEGNLKDDFGNNGKSKLEKFILKNKETIYFLFMLIMLMLILYMMISIVRINETAILDIYDRIFELEKVK